MPLIVTFVMPRFRLQFEHRFDLWCEARPEHKDSVDAWREAFANDPRDPRLEPYEYESPNGEVLIDYVVPGVPIFIVVLIERYESTSGSTWARLIRPRDAQDVVPDYDMLG